MLLEQWEPDQPIDIFLSGVVQVQLLIEYSGSPAAISDEDWIQAVRIYRQLINKLPQSPALRIGLASSLISLASNGQSIDRHRDLNEALEHAIIARDISRETFASSVQAVEVASQAAYSDMQFRRVIKLGTTITGEATAEEARSDIVQTFVTTAALLLGETEMADRLILEINDTFRKSILVAMSAEVGGRPLANLWVAALQQARDAYERAQALLGLARMGLAESEQIDNLNRDLPKEAALIRAVSEAATGNLAAAIRQLRLIQDSDISTVTALAGVYLQSGNASAAADTLREGARIFNEPRLRIEAARLLSENNDHNAAVVELEQLLIDSAGNAVVQRDCLGILAEWAAERGDWSTAQPRYREVLALDPSDYKVRWALILSLLQLGLIRDARRVYDEAPTTPEIVLPLHARAWMATRLATDRTDAARFVDEVVNIAQRFPDDENVQAEAIFTVLSPDSRSSDPLPSATQARFDRLFYHFTETWPQSSRLRALSAGDAQDLVSQMDELVRPTQDEKRLRAEIADQLARNVLPWATLSAITARSYSEIVITRAAGVLPAQSPDSRETQMCQSAAKAAINESVVLDISAAATLIEIPGISSLLVSQFERMMISEQERLDAVKAEFQLRSRGTESWVYDEQSDRGRIATITTEAANERHRKAEALLGLISRFKVTPVGASERTAQLGDLANSTWITTMECAAQSNAIMWCDDVALRAAARSIGVSAFSTPSLIDVLIQTDVLAADKREGATRTFIEGFIGDFPLDPVRLSVLVAKQDGAATPVASVFARTSAWTNFKYAYETWCTLVQQSANVDPRNASDWLYYAVLGAARSHQDDAQCSEVAAIILSAASSYVTEDPMQISRCVAAARSALVSLGRDSAQVDPLGRAVALLRESLARIIGIVDATSYVSRAFSNLQADDRQIVLRALYA